MASHFQRGFLGEVGGVYVCQTCGKITSETGEGESEAELCLYCYLTAGEYNSFQDRKCTWDEYVLRVLELRKQCKHPGHESDKVIQADIEKVGGL